MKNNILADVLVYIISPVLIFNFLDSINLFKYFIIGLGLLIISYTIINKKRESRINITGIIFSIVYIAFFSFKQRIQPGFQVYIVNTYFLIACTILIMTLNFLEKSIAKQIYIDYLKLKRLSGLAIFNIFKKSNILYYLKKIESLVTVNILVMIIIRVYSIATYGGKSYKTTTDLEILICVLFVIGEVYILYKIASQLKKEDKGLKKNINHENTSKRVINLNQYKNINK